MVGGREVRHGPGGPGRVMILDIQDFDKLSHLEIAPLVLSRR